MKIKATGKLKLNDSPADILELKLLGPIINKNKQDYLPLMTLNRVTFRPLNLFVLIFLLGHDRQNGQLQNQASKGRK